MIFERVRHRELMEGVTEEMQNYLLAHKKPLSKREYDAIKINIACNVCTEAMLRGLEERLKMIPGGWRDARMLNSVYKRLFNKLLLTVPAEKLNVIHSEMKYLELYVKVEGAALYDPDENDNVVIPRPALKALAGAAGEQQCTLCDKCGKAAKRCKLRKILASTFCCTLPETVSEDGACIFNNYDFSDEGLKMIDNLENLSREERDG